MSGTLYVVATPIGNLEDITLRALRTLREVDLIAAEDTRRTARLLSAHGISTPQSSFHAHNAHAKLKTVLARLEGGAHVALVSDAGSPGISDPGSELIQACIERGVRIDVIPGATAPITAALGSGFPAVPLAILGFAPHKAKDRTHFITTIRDVSSTVSFFESPHRVRVTLSEMASILGDRPICVCRELTKVHQEFIRGTSASVASQIGAPKGEFTIVVGPAAPEPGPQEVIGDAQIAAEFGRITECGQVQRRQAVSQLAKRFGMRASEVYSAIERQRNLV